MPKHTFRQLPRSVNHTPTREPHAGSFRVDGRLLSRLCDPKCRRRRRAHDGDPAGRSRMAPKRRQIDRELIDQFAPVLQRKKFRDGHLDPDRPQRASFVPSLPKRKRSAAPRLRTTAQAAGAFRQNCCSGTCASPMTPAWKKRRCQARPRQARHKLASRPHWPVLASSDRGIRLGAAVEYRPTRKKTWSQEGLLRHLGHF